MCDTDLFILMWPELAKARALRVSYLAINSTDN